MTFDEALSLVPENWHLVSGLDKVLRGDYFMPPESYGSWFPVVHENKIGMVYDHRSCICLRPIPDEVRRAEAWWIQYDSLCDLPPLVEATRLGVFDKVDCLIGGWTAGSMRGFSSEEKARNAIAVLGGDSMIAKMFSRGRGDLWRWVQENRNA